MGSDGAFKAVLRHRTLRRLQYAVLGAMLGRTAFLVAIAVWAYRIGGPGLVGLAGFLRLAPGAIVAPLAATLADRYRRDYVMAASDLGRALLCFAVAGAVLVDAPAVAVLVLLALMSVVGSLFEPARIAIVPTLVDRAELLAAVNAVSSAVNSAAYFVGPALGALLLTVSSIEVTFVATGAALLCSVVFVLTLRPPIQARVAGEERAGWFDEARAGIQVLRDDRGLRLLIGLLGLQTLIAGAVTVFTAVIALDLLEAGRAWVGILDAMAGIGALVGVAITVRVTIRRRLSTGVITGLALWGVPLLLVAFWDARVAAVLAMVLIGIGDSTIDVSAITLLQRIVPEALLGRVWGVAETVVIGGLAAGALLAPVAIELLGATGALVAFACLPAAALFVAPAVRALDARAVVEERPRSLLRGLPIFGVLPLPVLDGLAMSLRPVEVADGEPVVSQGQRGDRYFVVDEGEVDVLVDGEVVTRLARGEGFGEIALLRDVPRAATVVACGPVRLLALERDAFLRVVTGHAGATRAADRVMSRYRARGVPEPVAA